MGTLVFALGQLSGKIGNIVVRKRGGKMVVARPPSPRTTPKSGQEIEANKKFALTGKIAQGINSIADLKVFWKPPAFKDMSAYNLIFKKNFRRLNPENLEGVIMLTEENGFEITNPGVYLGETNVLIECEAIGRNTNFDTSVEKYVFAAGIIVCAKPSLAGLAPQAVIAFQTKKQLLYPGEFLCVSENLSGPRLSTSKNYELKRVFAVFITSDESGRVIQASNTFYK
jgi:hypothetical protein